MYNFSIFKTLIFIRGVLFFAVPLFMVIISYSPNSSSFIMKSVTILSFERFLLAESLYFKLLTASANSSAEPTVCTHESCVSGELA